MISNDSVLQLALRLADLKFIILDIPCLLVCEAKLDSTGLLCNTVRPRNGWTTPERACGLRQWFMDAEDLTWLSASQHRDKKIQSVRSKTPSQAKNHRDSDSNIQMNQNEGLWVINIILTRFWPKAIHFNYRMYRC